MQEKEIFKVVRIRFGNQVSEIQKKEKRKNKGLNYQFWLKNYKMQKIDLFKLIRARFDKTNL